MVSWDLCGHWADSRLDREWRWVHGEGGSGESMTSVKPVRKILQDNSRQELMEI